MFDAYSGKDGWGAAFRDRGHNVISADFDPRFGANFVMDMLDLKAVNGFDVILASPPCDCFSVASIGHHWTGGRRAYQPKTEEAKVAMQLAHHTFALIEASKPRWWVVENPRGVMRKIVGRDPVTTWLCQWGVTRAKPTDLWTNLTGDWPTCHNGNPDHEEARRGAKTGTQGIKGAADRALIPYALSLAVCIACETDGVIRPMVKADPTCPLHGAVPMSHRCRDFDGMAA